MADKKARDIMSDDCTCIGENDSVLDAAKRLAELDVGSVPICGEDDRLKGMLTDRDIVVKALAQERDPITTVCGELAQGTVRATDTAGRIENASGQARRQEARGGPGARLRSRSCEGVPSGRRMVGGRELRLQLAVNERKD